jgi:hypothetical protein
LPAPGAAFGSAPAMGMAATAGSASNAIAAAEHSTRRDARAKFAIGSAE